MWCCANLATVVRKHWHHMHVHVCMHLSCSSNTRCYSQNLCTCNLHVMHFSSLFYYTDRIMQDLCTVTLCDLCTHDSSIPILDVNECDSNNGGCSDYCINSPGSYNCTCRQYADLDADERHCTCIAGFMQNDGTLTCDGEQGHCAACNIS